ncbi:unnamed protein product [Albugo candida]|uniref:Uncharacterized protein n=1 Tax=Albugo candida TaxID=65357 RepID=A0A024GVA1_9STRA|nr:unnamed protein product [Albugo candida]|eukprot:CCI50943.1 unnamed protein product [Albugo candida]
MSPWIVKDFVTLFIWVFQLPSLSYHEEAAIFQAYCLGGLKPLPTLPGIELTTSGRGSVRSSAQPTELGADPKSTHIY